ncbi:MAG: HAD family hydrolase [Bacteroidota bacterium]
MIILDLDDTIFQTSSMNPKIFDSAFSVLRNYYESVDLSANVDKIITALWTNPIDVVLTQCKIPTTVVSAFYKQIESVDFNTLSITPFEDYEIMQSIEINKILVTTGLTQLQMAKVKALEIKSDFDAIKIDDPRIKPRQYKLDIFRQILIQSKIDPKKIWVIGDNPNSELKAGKQLGMNTIQRRSASKQSSKYADYEISSFEEIVDILY